MSAFEINYESLSVNGFCVVQPDTSMPKGDTAAQILLRVDYVLDRMVEVGNELTHGQCESTTSYRLTPTEAEGKGLVTPHLEGIYTVRPLANFMLGCISSVSIGGETFIMNGISLAARIRSTVDVPDDFRVRYGSWGGAKVAPISHPLFVDRGSQETVMFAHSGSVEGQTPEIDTPENRDVLKQVEEVVSEAVDDPEITTDVALGVGQILIVENNGPTITTLHHRRLFEEDYPGQRLIARMRLCDPSANAYTNPEATQLNAFRELVRSVVLSRPSQA